MSEFETSPRAAFAPVPNKKEGFSSHWEDARISRRRIVLTMKLKLAVITAVILSATWAMAQGSVNLTGTWKAKTVSARGSSEQTMMLNQSGTTFTGEMTNAQGVKETIKDGKISGSDITFAISRKQ